MTHSRPWIKINPSTNTYTGGNGKIEDRATPEEAAAYLRHTRISVSCLHCKEAAIASCLVADSDIILQLVCAEHIDGTVLWRKNDN